MVDDLIPADVRDFVQRHIDSVAALEALLLLRGTPSVSWDIAKAAQRLYAPEQEIAEALARLAADGILGCRDGTYCYECAPDIQQKVDRLAVVYSRHLIPVTNMIHAKPRRIREFADAFKFRRKS